MTVSLLDRIFSPGGLRPRFQPVVDSMTFRLRYAEGLSYEELAQIRGISVNTVKSQLARGKTILRAALAEGDHA